MSPEEQVELNVLDNGQGPHPERRAGHLALACWACASVSRSWVEQCGRAPSRDTAGALRWCFPLAPWEHVEANARTSRETRREISDGRADPRVDRG